MSCNRHELSGIAFFIHESMTYEYISRLRHGDQILLNGHKLLPDLGTGDIPTRPLSE